MTQFDEISHALGQLGAEIRGLHEKHDREAQRSAESRSRLHQKMDDMGERMVSVENRAEVLERQMGAVEPVVERVRRREWAAWGIAVILAPFGAIIGAVFGQRVREVLGL